MHIAVGSDHAGFYLKEYLKGYLARQGHKISDLGCYSTQAVDYPDQAADVGNGIAQGRWERGVLVCGTGIGVSIAANKVDGVRAARVTDVMSARLARSHNDANVICLGAWMVGNRLAEEIVQTWLTTPFEQGKHIVRVEKIARLEQSAPRLSENVSSVRTSIAVALSPGRFAPIPFVGDLPAILGQVAEIGFQAVELHVRTPEEVPASLLEPLLAQNGLRVSAFAPGRSFLIDGLSFTDHDESIRHAAIERINTFSQRAAELGAAVFVGFVRGKISSDPEQQAIEVQYLEECCRSCCEFAAPLGVDILFEPINRYEVVAFNNVADTLSLLDRVGMPNLRLLLDTFHMNIEESSIPQALRKTAGRTPYIHVVDSNRLAPGLGHTDFDEVARALRDIGFAGYISAEILPFPDAGTAGRTALQSYRHILDIAAGRIQ